MTHTTHDDRPATWALGHCPAMAERLLEAATTAVNTLGIRSGHTLLDTGTGNAALLTARAGGAVTAVDPTPRLFALAEARARQQNHTCPDRTRV